MEKDELSGLLKIGLTKGEAKVYIALSTIGSSTVGPIVKKSGVAYSNVYDILSRLVDKGIVSFVLKNKTKHFQAASPSNLVDYLDKREEEVKEQKDLLKNILPVLEKLQESKQGQGAEVFLGKKGLRSAYERLYSDIDKEDELVFFYVHKEEYAEGSNLFYNSISEITHQAKNRGICNKDYKNSWFAKKANFLKIRFSDIPLPGSIDIIRDKVLITIWDKSVFSVLIHSEVLADSLRDYFEKIWKMAKP